LLALILIVVWVGPVLLRIDPIQQEINERLLPPGGSHILGTDNFGRDLASRILHAGRLDVQFAIVSTAITLVVGVAVGAIAGFYGGWIDALFMRLVDIAVAFPKLVLVIAIVSILGTGLLNMYLTIVLVSWYSYARVIRGEVLLAKNMEYVEAARCVGANSGHIIWRHVLPNVISPAVVYAAADAVQNILFAASLGYLGLGIQPPTPEWGTMVAEARGFMLTNPQLTIYPGLAIVVTGIAFSLIGDGLTDALRPGE
jgi:peptide/nickel transport system permease protein